MRRLRRARSVNAHPLSGAIGTSLAAATAGWGVPRGYRGPADATPRMSAAGRVVPAAPHQLSLSILQPRRSAKIFAPRLADSWYGSGRVGYASAWSARSPRSRSSTLSTIQASPAQGVERVYSTRCSPGRGQGLTPARQTPGASGTVTTGGRRRAGHPTSRITWAACSGSSTRRWTMPKSDIHDVVGDEVRPRRCSEYSSLPGAFSKGGYLSGSHVLSPCGREPTMDKRMERIKRRRRLDMVGADALTSPQRAQGAPRGCTSMPAPFLLVLVALLGIGRPSACG